MTSQIRRCGRAGIALVMASATAPVVAQDAVGFSRGAGPLPLGLPLIDPGGTPREIGDAVRRGATGDRDATATTSDDAAPRLPLSVSQRRRPEFDAAPRRIGAFLASGEASARLGYDSNVLRQRSGSEAQDGFGLLTVKGQLVSDLPQHRLTIAAGAAERAYFDRTTESAFTYDLHVGGQVDFTRTDWLTVDLRRQRLVLDRAAATEIITTRRPVRYDLTSVGASGHKAFGRFAIDLSGLVSRRDYQDPQTPEGVPLDFSFRDSRTYSGRLDLAYALGPGPVLFVAASTERRRYNQSFLDGFGRNARTYQVLGGVRGAITPLVRGQIGIGYLHGRVRDNGSRGGLGLDTSVEWLVTELTTVTLNAGRAFRSVASRTRPEALATTASLGVKHELRRDLILASAVSYDRASYVNDNGGATRWEASLGTDYLVDRRFRLNSSIGYRAQNGFGRISARDYHQLIVLAGVSFEL